MIKIGVPLVILLVLIGAGYLILSNPPSVERRGPPDGPATVVEVTPVQARSFSIDVPSYGTVAPRTQSALVAQVNGQIISVADNFRPGGFFSAGDALLTIDGRDYEADVMIAEASLMDALQVEAQERARSEQALQDWQRLSDAGEEPSDLVLRKPQLQAAKARVASAQSNLTKAKLDLERTIIRAPFDGRLLTKSVDVGQVVNMGTPLAEIYATDYVEVRLPIKNADLNFVDLPEAADDPQPSVALRSELGDEMNWSGRIVRTEGAIDTQSRQLHVVAQIDNPFRHAGGQRPLKIGEYVTATIAGRTLPRALVIPNETIYQNSYVYLVDEGVLRRQEVVIQWQNHAVSIISQGLRAGDQLVTTPLGQVTSGTRVRLANARPPGQKQSGQGQGSRDGVAR